MPFGDNPVEGVTIRGYGNCPSTLRVAAAKAASQRRPRCTARKSGRKSVSHDVGVPSAGAFPSMEGGFREYIHDDHARRNEGDANECWKVQRLLGPDPGRSRYQDDP